MSCWMVVDPRGEIHFTEALWCNSTGWFPKADASIRRGDTRAIPPHLAQRIVSLHVLEEGQRGRMCQGGLGELQALGKRVHSRVGGKDAGAQVLCWGPGTSMWWSSALESTTKLGGLYRMMNSHIQVRRVI